MTTLRRRPDHARRRSICGVGLATFCIALFSVGQGCHPMTFGMVTGTQASLRPDVFVSSLHANLLFRGVETPGIRSVDQISKKQRDACKIIMRAGYHSATVGRVRKNMKAHHRSAKKLKTEEKIMMKVVAKDAMALRLATKRMRGDRKLVTRAVRHNGWALQYAARKLKADRAVVMKAVSHTGNALQYAAEELRGDREIVMAAITQNGNALKHATQNLRGDRELVMMAVASNGMALQHARSDLRGDRQIVMKAVSNNGLALKHATEDARGDREIVTKAVSRTGLAFQHATEKLRADSVIGKKAVKRSWEMISFYVMKPEKVDEEAMEIAVASSRGAALYLKVKALSGLCFHPLFAIDMMNMQALLRGCVSAFGLDASQVVSSICTLICGPAEISDLRELQGGKVYNTTLVLSSLRLFPR